MRALLLSVMVAGCSGVKAPARPTRFVETPSPPPAFPADRRAKLVAALPEVEKLADEGFAALGVPGMAVGLVVDGELLWSKGYGVRDLETQAPVDAGTVFRIASMTKSFTGVAILQLRDAGKLRLDDPAARWVPELAELRYPTRDSRVITIRDLLSHGAGFPEDNASGDHTLDWPGDRVRARVRQAAMSGSPGAQFEYSNLGFMILGLIVERASGERYTDYVTRHLLAPLGLRDSRWSLRDVPRDRAAQGYERRPPAWDFVALAQLGNGAGAAMGGLYTSVRDLSRWVAWQLAAFPPRDEPDAGPLSRASRRELQTPEQSFGLVRFAVGVEAPTTMAQGYALGLGSSTDCRLGRVVAHGGGLPGFGSFMVWLPDRGVGVITMTNQTYTSGNQVARTVLMSLLEKGLLPERVARPGPALLEARLRLDQLLAQGDGRSLRAAFDGPFVTHGDIAGVERAFAGLRARHGACRATGEIKPENALRGGWTLACERGEVPVVVELTVERKFQAVVFAEKIPPSRQLRQAARLILAALRTGDPGALEPIAHAALDRDQANAVLGRWRAGCVLGEATGGDGVDAAAFDLTCGKSKRALRVELADGKLRRFELRQHVPQTCP